MNEEAATRPLAERTLGAVADLIPCDVVPFDNLTDEHRIPVSWNNNAQLLNPEIAETCSRVYDDDPFANPLSSELIHNGSSRVLKLSDFGGKAQFTGTPFYNEVLRPMKIRYQMGLVLYAGEDLSVSCSVNRSDRDFTERERGLLSMAAPHIANAIGDAVGRETLRENGSRLEGLFETSGRGVIVIDVNGSVLQLTDRARSLLDKYFPGEPREGLGLPERLRNWVGLLAQNAATSWQTPYSLKPEKRELRVSRIFDLLKAETTLLLEEKPHLSPTDLRPLGLTNRQAEVLYWISRGKTDETIADLIGTSRRTVEKHLENIYRILGVETRTSAAMAAIERLGL